MRRAWRGVLLAALMTIALAASGLVEEEAAEYYGTIGARMKVYSETSEKSGSLGPVEPGTLVVTLATQDFLYEKMLSNIEEVKARGAHVLSIAKEGNTAIEAHSNEVIYIPACRDEITPLLSVVPLQLFAYYVAKERGCNIDKPKNLAKSVTVE